MEIILHNLFLFTTVTSVSSLGLLRRTSVASSPVQTSLSKTFFTLPEEMNAMFSENRQASLSNMGYHSMSMSFLSMSLPTKGSGHEPVLDGTFGKVPTTSSPETIVTGGLHSPSKTTTTPVFVLPYTAAPSNIVSSSDSNDTDVKPIKTPAKTVTSKTATSKSNEAQEWRPEIVLPVVFLALAVLVVLGTVVARRRRRGASSVGSSNSSLSPSPSDTSVDATGMHGVEI